MLAPNAGIDKALLIKFDQVQHFACSSIEKEKNYVNRENYGFLYLGDAMELIRVTISEKKRSVDVTECVLKLFAVRHCWISAQHDSL